MKTNDRLRISRKRAPSVRGLICVLFFAIGYSATFGVVHNHGNPSSELAAHLAAGSAGQAIGLSEIQFRSHSQFPHHSKGKECLICLLHRQFSSTIVHAHFVDRPAPRVEFASPVILYRPVSVASRPIARLSGRAPPRV